MAGLKADRFASGPVQHPTTWHLAAAAKQMPQTYSWDIGDRDLKLKFIICQQKSVVRKNICKHLEAKTSTRESSLK